MSLSSSSSNGAANQELHPQARRLIHGLISKALAYFEQREEINLKLVRQHLLELLDAGPPPLRAQNLRSAYTLLVRQGDGFNRIFRSVFQAAMREEERLAAPDLLVCDVPKSPVADAMDGISLSLIDMVEVERILLVDRVVLRFTEFYEASVNPLTQRMAMLLGLKVPLLARNPFRPEVFVRAFLSAWEKSGLDAQATQDLMLALEPIHSVDLVPLYVDLNSTLMHAGIRPQTLHLIKKSAADAAPAAGSRLLPGVQSGTQGPSATEEVPPFDETQTVSWQAQDFLRKLGLGSPRVVKSVGAGGPVRRDLVGPQGHLRSVPADPKFITYLGQLQAGAGSTFYHFELEGQDPVDRNVLRQMRSQEEVQRAPDLDRGTLDALSEVFDFVFSDPALALQMKLVIGRLQIPVLKAAMLDRNFFFSADQPARRLVDTLAAASLAWAPVNGESDPLYVRVEDTIQRVLNEFEDDVTLFGDLVGEMSEFLFESEQQAQGQIAPITDQERLSEAFEQALAHAGEMIDESIQALPPELPLAPFLAPFLRNQWREVMARAWMKVEDQPEQWERTLMVMEQLIWSTEPKTRSKERHQLVAILPDLVRNLNASLDAIEWTGEARAKFTRRLMATHRLAIRMTRATPTNTASAPLQETVGADSTRAAETKVGEARFTAADDFDVWVQSFTRGMWFDFKIDDTTTLRRCLSWISPLRTRMLFTSRDGADPRVHSEREVAALLRRGQLKVIDQEPIVSRALERIMSNKAGA